MKGNIVVFSIVGCPFCIKAKALLDQRSLPYVDINLDKNPAARNSLIELTGVKTVPQIFFNEEFVGGFDDLNKLSDEEFEKLVYRVREEEPSEKALTLLEYRTVDDETKDGDADQFTCELDEYAKLVEEFKASGVIKDHSSMFKSLKKTFVGKEAVDWLSNTKDLDRNAAVQMFQQVVDRHFAHSVDKKEGFQDDDSLYQLLEDKEGKSLNMDTSAKCEPQSVSKLGEELRQLILSLYNSHISPDGKMVNYKAIANDEKFKLYTKHTAQLQHVQVEKATREEKLAFFINIYNALVIHGFVVHGSPKNLWQTYKFFNSITYVIGGYSYTLNDIENGILRSNRKAIGAFRKPFSQGDPRMKVALEKTEPLIHFALVCGAKSCPPIKTYSAKDIDNQLKLAAESFLEGDGSTVDMKKREVRLSQIFKWYKEDFGANKQEIVQFVHDHMGKCEKKLQIEELLQSNQFHLAHMPYDWSLNSKL